MTSREFQQLSDALTVLSAQVADIRADQKVLLAAKSGIKRTLDQRIRSSSKLRDTNAMLRAENRRLIRENKELHQLLNQDVSKVSF